MQSWIMFCVLTYLTIKSSLTIFEVTDTPGPIILGRKHAKAMGYIQYPAIKPPDITSQISVTQSLYRYNMKFQT